MKRITYSLIALVSAVLIFSSCGKELKVDVPFAGPKIDFTLDSATLAKDKATEKVLYQTTQNYNIDSILEKNNAGDIDEVKIKQAVLSLANSGLVPNLDFLSSCRVTVKTAELAETTIADYPVVAPGMQSLTLSLKGIDLKQQFSKKDVTITIYGVLNGPLPTQKVDMKMVLDYLLSLNLL